MADPVTWVMIGAAVIGAGGAVYSAESARQAGKYQSAIAKRNAAIAVQQAEVSEAAARRDARRQIGAIRAGYGAAGVVGSEGTPLDVLEESAAEAELDALTIRYQGSIGAIGQGDEGRLARMRGRSTSTAGYFQAGSALLSSGTDIYQYEATRPKRTG